VISIAFYPEKNYLYSKNHIIMLNKSIGNTIKLRRKELGISQSVLAELAEVSKNTIYKLERGISNPTLDIIEKIINILGMELNISVKKI